MQRLTKEGLQRTDKRIGLMNEILSAMDTVKYDQCVHYFCETKCLILQLNEFSDSWVKSIRCYAWESSFQSKVQNVRGEELAWFWKAQLLGAVCLIKSS